MLPECDILDFRKDCFGGGPLICDLDLNVRPDLKTRAITADYIEVCGRAHSRKWQGSGILPKVQSPWKKDSGTPLITQV